MAEIQLKLIQEPCSSSTKLEKLNQVPGSLNQVPGSSFTAVPTAPKLHEVCGIKTKTKLDAPDDILQILHNYFPWETIEDIDSAERYYYSVLWEQRYPKIDDIHVDMAKLKELSSILRGEYDRCRDVWYAYKKIAAQAYYELVEQLPSIKSDPSYKDLTTGFEKLMIKQALKQKKALKQKQNGQIQTPQQSLCSHLEVMRRKLQNIDNDAFSKADIRMVSVEHLLCRVNRIIKALEVQIFEHGEGLGSPAQ
ncbi:hypothetical protein MKX03_021877 [Papaver bracteatum]|nr:hypothetical protein MKX03_021877 [Papaver bracteatum]